jgi:hypothetical protein
MLSRALLLVLGALIFVSGTARAVDHGQFENIPDDIRFCSKACAARLALFAAIFPTGIERSTTYVPEAIGYRSTACGGECGAPLAIRIDKLQA